MFSKQPQHTDSATVTEHTNENNGRIGYVLSWLFFVLASAVCLFGCYAVYDVVASRPKANILLANHNLSTARKTQLHEKLKNSVQGNFFTADLHYLENEITDIDWVKSVKVSRQWPNGISVHVFPHHAVARFGSERLVSDNGQVFSGEGLNTSKNTKLPMLFGPTDKSTDIMRQYFQINQWFVATKLQLVELSVSEQMTWFLKFNNGLRVIVDKENSEKKLFRLSLLLNKQLKPLHNQIEAIDLRYRNGVAISWKDGQPENLSYLIKTKT